MENNNLSNFFDTKFSNQELKTHYEEFYKYLCENGISCDFDKAKACDPKACFYFLSYGAAAFTVNFLHKDKPLDENDKINEINAILPAFSFKLTENTTKSEIENISNTIEKIFLAIMSVDLKIFDIKSFDFFMSDDVTAERYMKIYDTAWAARDAWYLVEKYLDILERNEKLDEEAEKHPDKKEDYNNLKVKLALDRNEFAEVADRLNQIRLLRNYTVRLLDDLFIYSDSLPIEMAEFAKSDLWDMEHFKPVCGKRVWQQAIMMRKSKDMGIKIIKSPQYEKTLTIASGPQDFTLDAISKLRDATLEKDIVKKLEINISVSEKEEPVEAKNPEKQETKLNQKAETEEKKSKENSDEKEKEKYQKQEESTAQIKEKEDQVGVSEANKKEILSTITNQVKYFKDFSEFLSKLKDENLAQNIISSLACNNFSVLDMICAFVWVVCHFWKVPKGIGIIDVARIKLAYDNTVSGGTLRGNIRNGESGGNLTAISKLINISIAKLNEEKNTASVNKENQRRKEVAKI